MPDEHSCARNRSSHGRSVEVAFRPLRLHLSCSDGSAIAAVGAVPQSSGPIPISYRTFALVSGIISRE
jgi:hypothetical protein